MSNGVPNNTPYYTKEEQEEINEIASRLGNDEIVEIVAKQSKLKPGGSVITPDQETFNAGRKTDGRCN